MDRELEKRILDRFPIYKGRHLNDGDLSITRCQVCGGEARKVATIQQYTHVFWIYECRDRHIFQK